VASVPADDMTFWLALLILVIGLAIGSGLGVLLMCILRMAEGND
jgi:hypothetical protein